jgi:membrane-bound lytic murein transglycosylase D
MKSRLFIFLFVLGVAMGCSYTHQEIPPPSCCLPEPGSRIFCKPLEIILSFNIGIPEALAKPVARTEELDLKKSSGDPEDPQIAPLEQNDLHDLDFEMNNRIQWWIKRYTGPAKKHFRSELALFDTVRPTMEKIFASYGIPKDLVYLCMVESGGRPNAVSPAGATGYWQFTAGTAKNYKLTVNSWVDERRDMIKSTHAAARYLKSLYAIFNDWLLAGAAYNAGEGNLYRIMKKHPEIDTFWDISHHMPIKHETLDYIPKLIATIVLAKNRAYYGLNEADDRKDTVAYDTVRVPSLTQLDEIAKLLGVPNKQICLLNADLVRKCTPPSENGHELKVPKGTADTVAEYVKTLGSGKSREPARGKEKQEPTDNSAEGTRDAGDTAMETAVKATHTVKKGETLYRIAKANSVTVRSLMEANGLEEGQDLSIGQDLVIPRNEKDKKDRKDSKEAKGPKESKPEKSVKGRTHVVEKGDTLNGISRLYGSTVDEIMEANDLKNARSIQPKMVLNIPAKHFEPSPRQIRYTVKKGDTIWSISKRFDVSADDVVKWNKLKPTASIQPGDELTIRRR